MSVGKSIQSALQHHQAGRLGEAEMLYRQLLGQNPNHVEALHLLGVLASQVGRHEAGVELISRAIAMSPTQAEYHGNLGLALAGLKRWDQAIAAYRAAIRLKPDFVQACSNMGSALAAMGKTDEAVATLQQAIKTQPNHAEARYNLGNVLVTVGRLDEAVVHFRRALALRPGWRQAQNNLANAWCALGEWDTANGMYRKALADRPEDPLAHWNVGLMLLRQGQLASAWTEYEWRWKVAEHGLRPLGLNQPRWEGGELNGRRILIHNEQGLGDTIQFIRYVPQIMKRGGRVIVRCQGELLSLLRGMNGVEQFITTADPIPECDVYCPLPSLAAAMETTLATIPASIPYLHAEGGRSENWMARLRDGAARTVGLCWAGRPTHPHDRLRSVTLDSLAPLGSVPCVRWISLQKGETARQTKTAPFPIADWTEELGDFADTAALIDALDLVITVDTSVAHLAGALGKPVWVLVPFVPDWRWMLDRMDSPWYPTMRLFRQKRFGDWQKPIAQVADALRTL